MREVRRVVREDGHDGEVAMDKVRDPVCGMTIERDEAAATSEYQGKTFYFCNPGCKAKFDAEPGRYATES